MNLNTKNQLKIINQQIKELSSIYRGTASQYGISDNEFWVWYALLTYKGECTQQDICDMWSLPKQTVNSIISNLSHKGFLSLKAVAGSRNKKIICLSDEGVKYGEEIVKHIYHAEQRAFEKLSEQEHQNYIEIMQKYIEFLKKEVNENEKYRL